MALPHPHANSYALVTGASQGIGEAMACDLAKAGHNLILVARREQVLQTLADELSSHGITAEVFAADLSKYDEVTVLFE